jgi:putative RNA 2'-phosphotransferase
VPDSKGFVAYKELLQTIHEEEGWRYVRKSHLNEVLIGKDREKFEVETERIRALDRRWENDAGNTDISLPGLLFVAVRKRAHPVVIEKGLKAPPSRSLVLSSGRDMALRIGKRRDPDPIILEILAQQASMKGVVFYSFGDLILTDHIRSEFIAGPPVPKEVLEKKKERTTREKKTKTKVDAPETGTFLLDSSRDPDPYRKARKSKGKKPKGWKEEARKARRKGRKEG